MSGSSSSSSSTARAQASTPLPENLYEILNVSPAATTSELKAAYRQLSQKLHPDKHANSNSNDKEIATNMFTAVKEAYEILSSDKLRKIYDEFGVEAARSAASPELELVPYNHLAERFRQQRADENNDNNFNSKDMGKDAFFSISNVLEPRINMHGLLIAIEDNFQYGLDDNLVGISKVGLSSSSTVYITQKDTLSFNYALTGYNSTNNTINRRKRSNDNDNIGDIDVSWRRQLDPYTELETTLKPGYDEYGSLIRGSTLSLKAFRSLSDIMTMSVESTIRNAGEEVTTGISAARSFDDRCSASASWIVGARGGCAFSWIRHAYDEYVPESSSKENTSKDEFGNIIDEDKEEQEQEEEDEREETLTNDRDGVEESRIITFRKPTKAVKRIFRKMKRLTEPIGLRWTIRLASPDVSLSFVARRPIGESAPLWKKCEPLGPSGGNGSFAKLSGVVGMLGWEIKVGVGKRFVVNDTEVGTSLGVGTIGVMWRIKVKRGANEINIPIILQPPVGYIDRKAVIIGSIGWGIGVSLVRLMIMNPILEYIENKERKEAIERRQDDLERSRDEANNEKDLMKVSVESKKKIEKDKNGLLIERAVYGWKKNIKKCKFVDRSMDGREIQQEMVEVGDCVQTLVEESIVQVVSRTKCTLNGFWDASALGEKDDLELKIWYLFKGNPHQCVIRDDQPIEIPLTSHLVAKWT